MAHRDDFQCIVIRMKSVVDQVRKAGHDETAKPASDASASCRMCDEKIERSGEL